MEQDLPFPSDQVDIIAEFITENSHLLKTENNISFYQNLGFNIIADPYSKSLINPISTALKNKTPFSAIRIGDGEANLLTWKEYPNTPELDDFVFTASIEAQFDRFFLQKETMQYLKELTDNSIQQADIVGVLGLWQRPNYFLQTPDSAIKWLRKNVRGISGQIRGIDYLQHMARKNLLNGKIIASAHLYFSLIENLKELVVIPNQIYCLTNREESSQRIRALCPDTHVHNIIVGHSELEKNGNKPEFLNSTMNMLPVDMSGSLSLIGAGPYAEFYCNWIKQRGGVALDLGSGFDLLAGHYTRPIHSDVEIRLP